MDSHVGVYRGLIGVYLFWVVQAAKLRGSCFRVQGCCENSLVRVQEGVRGLGLRGSGLGLWGLPTPPKP